VHIPYTYLAILLIFVLLMGVVIGDQFSGDARLGARAGPGYLAINHDPDPMEVGQEGQVTAVVSRNVQEAIDELTMSFEDRPEGSESKHLTWITRRMHAKLHGRNFDIRESGPEERTIDRSAKWTWYVTPKRQGIGKPLMLDLYAVLSPGNQIKQIDSVPIYVDVNISLFDRVTSQWDTIVKVANGLLSIGTLVGIVLGWMGRSLIGRAK
jgi:hypothetical protein